MQHGVVLRLLDATVAAGCRPQRTWREDLRAIVGSSNFERIGSLLAILGRVRPGLPAKISRRFYAATHLPITTSEVSLLSYGSGGTVFLLRTPKGLFVLKVYRRSLGRSLDAQLDIVASYKEKHEAVSGWYNGDGADIVVPACFLILGGPIGSSRVAATLQPYIAGNQRDTLRMPEHELSALAQRHPALRRQFLRFADVTTDLFAADGRCLDLVGSHNVMLVEDTAPRLVIVDTGVFDLGLLRAQARSKYEEVKRLVGHIAALRDRIR